MRMKKALIGLSLLCMIVPGIAKSADSVAENNRSNIVANWKFTKQHVKSGSIDKGNLIIEDTSKHGNDLELVTIGDPASPELKDMIQWSEEDYHDQEKVDSLEFANYENAPSGRYFKTKKGSPINSEEFDKGFTIEAVFKLPSDSKNAMGLFSRQGQAADLNKMEGEKKILSALTVSSDQKIHWTSHPSNLNYNVSNWSRSLNADEWYHLAVVNDGDTTTLTLNGVSDYGKSEKVIGIAAVKGKGWNIGASEWGNKFNALFKGNIQQIRIANKALTEKEWLVQDARDDEPFEGSNKALPFLTNKKNYNFLFVPDTQKYSSQNPEIFNSQMNWISNNTKKNNIIMNTFVGDIVDSDSEKQWQNSLGAISHLDKKEIPYLMAAGNHDYADGDPFLTHYGPQRFLNKKYYKGSSHSGYSSYAITKAGSYEYLILIVDMKNLHKDLEWSKKVLDQHKDKPTILVSHDIIFPKIKDDKTIAVESSNGRVIWDELVKDHNQVFMTVNGHYYGIAHRVKQNSAGNDVIQMLVNYQTNYRGGNGWLRLVEFDEKKNVLLFRTYSPFVDEMSKKEKSYIDYKFLTGENNSFKLDWDFKKRFNFKAEKSNSPGVSD
ncbi:MULTISPECIES: LamG-like jellyroll fold domain-containing protein [Bacillaceae]|uniref:LamG-like jellyroll fold domain-containing protein n=1 Tax=Bacillaceae TaxID=186817 RepID=UPI0019212D8A|nr:MULTISPECIES: LamG-like jellyroll fold domain-containing protein [Bacillaceae]MCT4477103.1 metallophosphoesterase [Peribacillus frigoritolerans]CAH0299402.1 3',5'-cyclic adenosine monophosphate phosphodiesterase CpdA [Peribacillus sp. Bi134]